VTAVWWIIAVAIGLLLALVLVAAWTLAQRKLAPARAIVRGAARRLGGRIDPASEHAASPALLVELDGRLLRAVGWPEDPGAPHVRLAPYVEICTPVDGTATPVLAVRRSSLTALTRYFVDEGRRLTASSAGNAVALASGASAAWAVRVVEEHASWALVELEPGSLRVLATDPQSTGYDAAALERAVREFSAALPAILVAAGLADSSARSDQR
jgi:hypothetical protein